MAGERIDLACQLFSQGHGRQGVVLTGGNSARIASDRAALVSAAVFPDELLHQWPNTANSFEEMSAVASMLSANPGTRAIVVSDSLHMPRLRYIRERLALNGRRLSSPKSAWRKIGCSLFASCRRLLVSGAIGLRFLYAALLIFAIDRLVFLSGELGHHEMIG